MSNNESFEIAYCNIDDNEDLSNLAIQLKETKQTQEKIIEDSQIKITLLLKNKTTLIIVSTWGYLHKFSFSLEGVIYQESFQPKKQEASNEMIEIQHIMELSNGKLSVCSQCNEIYICNTSPFQIERTLIGHKDTVYNLCELNNAQNLVSDSQDSYLFIWKNHNVIKQIGGNKTLIPSPILHLASTKNFVVNWKSISTNTLKNSYLEFYDYTGKVVKCTEKLFTGSEGKMFEIKEKDHLVVVFDNELDSSQSETCLIVVDYFNFNEVKRIPVELYGDAYCFNIYLDSLLFLSGNGQLYQLNMYKC